MVQVEHALMALAGRALPGLISLMAFAAPHVELGEAVGAAVTCEPGASLSLKQLRAAGKRGRALSHQWLPELLQRSRQGAA